MEVLNYRPKQIGEGLVCFFIRRHDSDRVLGVLHSTLDTDLNVATLVGVLLLHVRPHFSGQVLL